MLILSPDVEAMFQALHDAMNLEFPNNDEYYLELVNAEGGGE